MKMLNRRIAIYFMFFSICVSCTMHDEVILSLNEYTKLDFVVDRIDVTLIKSFKNESKCTDKIKNANVYLCIDVNSNDTILLFEPCQKMPDFAYNNYTGERDLVIERSDLIKDDIKEISVLGNSAIFKKRYKYILGSLTFLIY